jgi:hypothetical protein
MQDEEDTEDTEENISRWASDPTYVAPVEGPKYEEEILALLDYPKRWYLHCQYVGCSCHFRHLGGFEELTGNKESDPYFSAPQKWIPEDEDDVVSTRAVYESLKGIFESGHSLDLVDHWSGTSPKSIRIVNVSFQEVKPDQFRFFGNFKFTFSA